ncbi:hypothetical protein PR048_031012 [Dryococelus australis]|uniref:Uncharacterized protein n=1 Tax=Dryococelus australis TaxID=614101 RepID=A0ABQ9G436_9NEOP|nr:hypothetical protein PR048_031012 [Dryococelus australis]
MGAAGRRQRPRGKEIRERVKWAVVKKSACCMLLEKGWSKKGLLLRHKPVLKAESENTSTVHRLTLPHILGEGGTVAERLACSPPTKAIRVLSPAGSLRIFAFGNRTTDDAVGQRVFSGISRFPRPFIPALHHSQLTSPSLALKTSLWEIRSAAKDVWGMWSATKDVWEMWCATKDVWEIRSATKDVWEMWSATKDVWEMWCATKDVWEIRSATKDVWEMWSATKDVWEIRSATKDVWEMWCATKDVWEIRSATKDVWEMWSATKDVWEMWSATKDLWEKNYHGGGGASKLRGRSSSEHVDHCHLLKSAVCA